jgi:hypothetical protein
MISPAPNRAWINRETLFLLAFALMMTHELDAVARLEWRVLPMTSWMPDDVGFHVFVAAHVPLVLALVHWAWRAGEVAGERLRFWFCAFCVVHVGLHWVFKAHPEYRFNNLFSNALIWGCGLAGLAWLLAAAAGRRRSASGKERGRRWRPR